MRFVERVEFVLYIGYSFISTFYKGLVLKLHYFNAHSELVGDQLAISSNQACRDSSNLSATCFRLNSIKLSRSQSWSQTWFLTCHRQVRAISTCRNSSNLVADRFPAGFRSAFDRPATRTRNAHAGLRPGSGQISLRYPSWSQTEGRRRTLVDGSLESPCRVLVKCN